MTADKNNQPQELNIPDNLVQHRIEDKSRIKWPEGNQVDPSLFRSVQEIVLAQEESTPSRVVLHRILVHVRGLKTGQDSKGYKISPAQMVANMIGGLLFAIAILLVLWLIIRPGIVLQWTVNSDNPVVYRVYRTSIGTNQLELRAEIVAQPSVNTYIYTDPIVIPGQAYTYYVQGMGQNGLIALSPPITGSTRAIFPSQLALLFTSLVSGFGMALLLYRYLNYQLNSRRPGFL